VLTNGSSETRILAELGCSGKNADCSVGACEEIAINTAVKLVLILFSGIPVNYSIPPKRGILGHYVGTLQG
jgi:hypothetical protein